MDNTSWQGPPADVLGQLVPIQQIVARTERALIALHYATAFPQGCLLTLRLVAQRGPLDQAAWESALGSHFGREPQLTPADGGLKLGVRFPDGSRVTTVEHAFAGWAPPSDEPRPPMLVSTDGHASSSDRRYDSEQQLWLWPLPPSGPFELVVEWRTMGLELTSVTVDGGAVVRAAEQALPFSV
jgi:hypothetical protein